MIRSIQKYGLDINNRISGNLAALHGIFYSHFNWFNELLWYGSPFCFILKFKPSAIFIWLKPDNYMTILSLSATLSDIFSFHLSTSGYCFPIRYLRFTNICTYAKLAQQPIYYNFKMKFPHT